MTARRSIEHTPRNWRENIPLEDTKGERKMRHILESLRVSFYSQGGYGDFTVAEFVIEVDGPHHNSQTQINHDAWKEQELRKLGFRVLRFKEAEVLGYPDMVALVIQSMLTLSSEASKTPYPKLSQV